MIGLHAIPGGVSDAGVAALGPRLPGVDVTLRGAETAEDTVAGLAEQQLLPGVAAALGHDLKYFLDQMFQNISGPQSSPHAAGEPSGPAAG